MTGKEKRRHSKRYLQRVRKLDSMIRIKKENLAEVKATLGYRAKNALERVQESISIDGICDAVIELLQLETEIGECITEYYRIKEEIIYELFSLKEAKHIDILSFRYLKYMKFEDIPDAMESTGRYRYDIRHIYRLHDDALEAFWEEVLQYKQKDREG